MVWNPTFFFLEILKTLKPSYDASDRLYGAYRYRVVEAVLNNSFQKVIYKRKKFPWKLSAPKVFKINIQTIFLP